MNEFCPKCGHRLLIEFPSGPSMCVERCPHCSYEGGGTISFQLPEAPLTIVSGYFQLLDIHQVRGLRVILPDLAMHSLGDLIERLRQQSLRWPVAALYSHEVREYQRQAASHGFSFVVESSSTRSNPPQDSC